MLLPTSINGRQNVDMCTTQKNLNDVLWAPMMTSGHPNGTTMLSPKFKCFSVCSFGNLALLYNSLVDNKSSI